MSEEKKDPQSNTMPEVSVGFVPTPTAEYRSHRKWLKSNVQPGAPTRSTKIPTPRPIPLPLISGPRVLMYKQDPAVAEIGIRKAYIPTMAQDGPTDSRIQMQNVAPVSKNALGDFIEAPGTEAFDTVHTFAVVRQTLNMYQRALGGAALPWQWNSPTNTDRINVFPRAGITQNAYYSRGDKAIKFFYFTPPGTSTTVYTCRSFDIVAHETGHAVLDALKPNWLLGSNPPQTGGLHESFGDLTAIFLALSQLDQVEAVIAQTKANLHNKTFLADLAEQFGLALGRPNGLRNADNDLKLSEAGTEVHAISQVFTGGIYDTLADIFSYERAPARKDDAQVLHDAGQYVCSLVLRAFIQAPDTAATYASVVNKMLQIAAADGKPVAYRNFIRNRFTVREVVVSATPLTADHTEGMELAVGIADEPGVTQDRGTCCGTMLRDEYLGVEQAIQDELNEMKKYFERGTIKEMGEAKRTGTRR